MGKTSSSRPTRRSFVSATLVSGFSFALISSASCSPGLSAGADGVAAGGAATGSGSQASAGGAGGRLASGGASSSGAATNAGGALGHSGGASATGGSLVGGGGGTVGSGGTVSAGGSGGSGTGGTAPCEDNPPPYDPTWPDATCESWALEAEDDPCSADWFSDYCDISCGRCVPEGGTGGSSAVDCSGEGLPKVTGGEGFATRYWDCCQPHCSQFDGHRCSQDGVSNTGDTNSSCNGGGSYACYDGAPHAVSDCLSYGHFAKANPNCGGCYRIEFTGTGHSSATDPGSKLIKGKQMIVKVTNTGGDVAGNQFDLMIPGGGVGQFNACSKQWGTSDLGAQYGGFLTNCTGSHSAKKECVRQECMKIPAGSARDGCIWFVDWFEVADNPNFTSQPTDCPF